MSSQPKKNNIILVRAICDTIDHENKKAEQIYKVLLCALKNAAKKRPVHENILGIYFIDLLKFFTGIGFRQIEFDQTSALNTTDHGTISTQWPYLLMHEIKWGFTLDQFDWGHNFNNVPALITKKFVTKILAFSNFFRGGAKKMIAITDDAMTLDRLKIAFRRRINLDLVSISKFGKIPIVDLDKQLDDLDPVIADILTIMRYPFDFETACAMLHNHIKANCVSGTNSRISKVDVLVAGSGCAIENRLMAYMARRHGMRVVNIFHGGSYGVQSKPTFNQGEKLMATDLAVFGQVQDFPGEEEIAFINGRYKNISPIAKTTKIKLPKIGDQLMYVPTGLRNENKRYGPYEDMSDRHYVKLWVMMREIFGAELIIKLHPKSNASIDVAAPIITENFEYCLDRADTFIFDYVSTAFTLAAGTDKPIIYLDYGLQNFTEQGIKSIKSRCIYYDMRLDLPNIYDEVVDKAKSMTFNHDYIERFVAADGQETIDEAVFSALLT